MAGKEPFEDAPPVDNAFGGSAKAARPTTRELIEKARRIERLDQQGIAPRMGDTLAPGVHEEYYFDVKL